MADGNILIDARIQTDEAKKDTQDLKKQLESLADSASASAKNIEKSFNSLSIEDAAEGLGESFEREAQEVEDIPDQIQKEFDDIDLEDVADGLADGFGEEADKTKEHSKETEKAIEALTDKIKRQEKELGTLKTAYINARSEYGETADETQRLAREIEELSSDLGKSKKEFREAADAADQLDKSLDNIDVPENLDGIFAGITAGLTEKALDLIQDAGRAIVEFGENAIDLASDLQEVQNVVDTAFPHMSRQVEEFAESAISSAGLSETAAKKYLGTYGTMAKSFGFTEEAAFNLSETMVQLAGDVSSFYNISTDEAYTKLMAIFTGETEALKELGVVMTETELNAYAMEKGLDKGTQGMDKQEKAALRLEYAMEALSAAQGDFIKTSDSWANQTKIMSENWNSLSASIGEGLIISLTPAIQFINDSVMPALQDMADRFADMKYWSDILGENNLISILLGWGKAADETAESVSDVATEAFNLIPVTETLSNATAETAATVETLRQEYDAARESAKESLDSQIGLLTELKTTSDKSAKDIINNWANQKQALEQYTANMQKAIDMGLDEALVRQLSDGSQESMQILQELVTSTDTDVDAINEAFRGVEEAKETVSGTMADIQTDMSGRLAELAGSVESEWGTMATTVGASISEMQGYINSLQGKDVYVNVITRSITSGNVKTSGVTAAPNGATPRVASAAPVPYLASGAVIPPNAPFMAMLGDQRNGTNLEAPEGLIRNLFREEMSDLLGSNLAGFEAVVAELQATRSAIEDIQIGDTTIGRAAARYDRRQNLIRGGSTG